jgi:CrcB protein
MEDVRMERLLLLFLAGGAGTLARYGMQTIVQRLAGPAFPWGTFMVNVSGSFLFGLLWIVAADRNLLNTDARLIILTGFLGAYTTFSTFMFDTTRLFDESQFLAGGLNVVGQVIIGLMATYAGMVAGRLL